MPESGLYFVAPESFSRVYQTFKTLPDLLSLLPECFIGWEQFRVLDILYNIPFHNLTISDDHRWVEEKRKQRTWRVRSPSVMVATLGLINTNSGDNYKENVKTLYPISPRIVSNLQVNCDPCTIGRNDSNFSLCERNWIIPIFQFH